MWKDRLVQIFKKNNLIIAVRQFWKTAYTFTVENTYTFTDFLSVGKSVGISVG